MNAYREHQQHMEDARRELEASARKARQMMIGTLAFALALLVGAAVLFASPFTGWTCWLAIPAGVVTFGAVMWMEMR